MTSASPVARPADAPVAAAVADALRVRLRRVIELHFDPDDGSRFWLDRAARLGFDPRSTVRDVEDLALLGEMTPADLASRPLWDFVPRRFHWDLRDFVVCQTGGTTGPGKWTAYRSDELDEAFVDPFVAAARHLRFPRGEPWLFVGPSGPHVIGKVVSRLARAMASPEPFAVDFDPRWARRLADGSFARQRYLGHVVEQAMDVVRSQDVGVLFTTPPVLAAMADQMSEPQRRRIRAVHYGGLAVDPEHMRVLQQETFPEALHLAGYGNTLFGCCLELNNSPGRPIDYYPHGNRLFFEVVREDGSSIAPGGGATGRVRFTRLDESVLLVRMAERDAAALLPAPSDPSFPAGFVLPGVRNPRPAAGPDLPAVSGLY
jgi:phenylacetate-coenzyme A ligase PaaK-like adenylate-forming protein